MKSLRILVRAILAGVGISIGGTVYLMLGRSPLGAFLFGIGLFMVVTFGYNLYTGKVGYVIENKVTYLWELFLTLIGNLIGTLSVGYVLSLTRIGTTLRSNAEVISNIKINDGLLSIFILSIFCGVLMYTAVDLYKKLRGIGKYIAVFICVTVFILAGFEHCVANMYYFTVAGVWGWNAILSIYVMIIGNSLGSILLALGHKFGLTK